MKYAKGIATTCCGTPAARASQAVFLSDFQNHSSPIAKAKLSRPTNFMDESPAVGSQL